MVPTMRIGVMLRHLGEPGGIGVYTSNVLDALFAIDRNTEYLALYASEQAVGRFSGIPNVREEVVRAPNKFWWDQIAVPRLAQARALDLIYNPKLSVPLRTTCRTVLVMHGADQLAVPHGFKWADRMYFTVANRVYCRAATAIIATTHLGARDIATYMAADPRKIHVVNLAYNERCRVLDGRALGPVRERWRLPEHFVLFVGGLEPKKNIRNVILAYDRIRRGFPHRLVFVGFPRWKYSRDLELLDRLQLRDHVMFTGFVPDDDLPAIYNLADLFLFPSLYEGFGMPVLEAMACGCPVVTTSTGCSPEVAGDAALLVDPYDVDAIAAASERVLLDDVLRKELVGRGLARVRQFSWRRCAAETLTLFQTLQGSPQ
jgi:glycosyltransferase involved in cell wall biosynthesis